MVFAKRLFLGYPVGESSRQPGSQEWYLEAKHGSAVQTPSLLLKIVFVSKGRHLLINSH
jgi:hypothetical protein